jgi:hypothetical protein
MFFPELEIWWAGAARNTKDWPNVGRATTQVGFNVAPPVLHNKTRNHGVPILFNTVQVLTMYVIGAVANDLTV